MRKDNDKSIPLEPYIETRTDGKSNCLSTVQKDNVVVQGVTWRKLTPLECERLQTIDDGYTENGVFHKGHPSYSIDKISNSQRYKMLGNGFVVDVVAHILKPLSMKKYGVQYDS
jgi:site-specific DNA-cytosine methylase